MPSWKRKIAVYLRRTQSAQHGGWPLFQDGDFDMSASVKAYFALKMIGDSIDAPHMARARQEIRARGGAAGANVFTKLMLALFGFIPWRAVPVMPVEIMLFPKWFPFHLDKISYWSRTVIVPLLVLMALKPRARNPKNVRIDELFLDPPATLGPAPKAPQQNAALFWFFRAADNLLRWGEPMFPKKNAAARDRRRGGVGRRAAQRRGRPRRDLSGDGQQRDDVRRAGLSAGSSAAGDRAARDREASGRARRRGLSAALRVADLGHRARRPCAAGNRRRRGAAAGRPRGCNGSSRSRCSTCRGDWIARRPDVRPGGWAFQYANPHYPDVDDTAVVALAMDRAQDASIRRIDHRAAIARAQEWILGLQSKNGAWGAFDADNEYHYLNHIPFADHGALLDPPTEDVTARCVSMLAQLGETPENSPAVAAAVDYLKRTQHPEGSWYGRWGMNYIYGTWSVLCALNAAGVDHGAPEMRKAAAWLISIQNADGGWGEDGTSYKLDYRGYEPAPSTASQTAWALLGLMATGDVDDPAVARGIEYLQRNQGGDGFWEEARYTATGFPRVFYLRYHGYPKFFPLWALARYRNLTAAQRPHRQVRDVSCRVYRTSRIELGLLLVAELAGEVVERHVDVGGGEDHGGQAVGRGVETLRRRRRHRLQARRHQELTHLGGLLLQRFEAGALRLGRAQALLDLPHRRVGRCRQVAHPRHVAAARRAAAGLRLRRRGKLLLLLVGRASRRTSRAARG